MIYPASHIRGRAFGIHQNFAFLRHRNDNDGDAVMHHGQDDRAGHVVSTSIDAMQESRDYGILRVAPKEKVCFFLSECWIDYPTRLTNFVE